MIIALLSMRRVRVKSLRETLARRAGAFRVSPLLIPYPREREREREGPLPRLRGGDLVTPRRTSPLVTNEAYYALDVGFALQKRRVFRARHDRRLSRVPKRHKSSGVSLFSRDVSRPPSYVCR